MYESTLILEWLFIFYPLVLHIHQFLSLRYYIRRDPYRDPLSKGTDTVLAKFTYCLGFLINNIPDNASLIRWNTYGGALEKLLWTHISTYWAPRITY
jgi:hypothetical protein